MNRPRLIVVDPDASVRGALRLGLGERGFDVGEAASLDELLPLLASLDPEALLARVAAPGDGPVLARSLAAHGCDASVVVVASPDRLPVAIEAMRAGAESYLLAPAAASLAAVLLERALEKRRLRREGLLLREQVRRRHVMVGSAPGLVSAQELIRRAAPTKATVLVLGESGTGRELAAQLIHEASPRRARPFVRVSCSAVSERLLEAELFGGEPRRGEADQGGDDMDDRRRDLDERRGDLVEFPGAEASRRREGRIEAADGGTLFLHEVSRLPSGLQVRLLRVLQHGELERVGGTETVHVDVRVVASSTPDLAEEVRSGRFREDLYYRLSVVALQLPPLRERKGDLPALLDHLLARAASGLEWTAPAVSPGALSALFSHDWPGNVLELDGVLERARVAAGGEVIAAAHLPPALHGARPEERAVSALIPGATLFEIERDAILRTLEEVDGSTVQAAEVLGVSVRTIQYRLKEYFAGHLEQRRAVG